jgi:hypothetical protein
MKCPKCGAIQSPKYVECNDCDQFYDISDIPCHSCAEKDAVIDELAGMALTLNNALGDVACDGSAIGKYQMGMASRAEFIAEATRRARQVGKEK